MSICRVSYLQSLCQCIHSFSRLPVIVFTGRDDIASKALCEGADDYIAKPFKPEELTKKIKTILEKTEAVGEQPFSTVQDESKA